METGSRSVRAALTDFGPQLPKSVAHSRCHPANLALSQTGNWLNRRLDLDGNGAFTGTGELDETNTFSLANELKARNTDSSGGDEFTLGYDKVGNQTDDGEDYTYVYDPWGRLCQVKNQSSALVAEYKYNGFGFRTGWHYDANTSGTVDGSDPWYWFCYDDRWRMVASFRDTDANPKEVFVHHNAGLGGFGGSSYIDSVILRDRDASTGWTSAADSNREERRYYCQNWRADISAILTSNGKMVEWEKYSAYGVPYALPSGDTDSDGDWDPNDAQAILVSGGYDVRQDAELDGDVDNADATHAHSVTGGYQTLGRGLLSSTGVNNRRGYAGYEYDPTFEGAERRLYHARHRAYDANVGRWTRRDPLGYVDGMNLYEYVRSDPLNSTDPLGLASAQDSCEDVDKFSKKDRKLSFPEFDHDRFGANWHAVVRCGPVPILLGGWGRVDDIISELNSWTSLGCCIKHFDISAHHSAADEESYTCDDHSDACSDAEFGSLKLCKNSNVTLNMCNSCGIADKLKENNPDADGSDIQCVDGWSWHHPGLGIDFTPLSRYLPALQGTKEWIRIDAYSPDNDGLPPSCPPPPSDLDEPGTGGRCQDHSDQFTCHDTYYPN